MFSCYVYQTFGEKLSILCSNKMPLEHLKPIADYVTFAPLASCTYFCPCSKLARSASRHLRCPYCCFLAFWKSASAQKKQFKFSSAISSTASACLPYCSNEL
ncbi:hypothetical protein M514_08280, partial [Trichuris suis]